MKENGIRVFSGGAPGWASAVEALETVADCSRQTRVPAPSGHVWRERAANAYLVPKPDRGVTRRTATESEMRHTAASECLDRAGRTMSYVCMSDDQDPVHELEAMRERIRAIRTRYCEPKSNANPRYLALSNVVTNLSKVIDDMKAEAR